MPNYPYILFLTTLLGGPVIAGIIVRFVAIEKLNQGLKILVPLLLLKNVASFFDVSFRGDYADYTVLATEYITVCVVVFILYRSRHTIFRLVSIAGFIGMTCGFLAGLIGILLFASISFNYVPYKIVHFEHDSRSYETRCYAYTELLPDEYNFTFYTYQSFEYLPLERILDRTMIVETQTQVNLGDDSLKVTIRQEDEDKMLVLTDRERRKYMKQLD